MQSTVLEAGDAPPAGGKASFEEHMSGRTVEFRAPTTTWSTGLGNGLGESQPSTERTIKM